MNTTNPEPTVPQTRVPTPTTTDPGLSEYFAKLSPDLPAYRNDLFYDTGPVMWLDKPDAHSEIDRKLAAGEITSQEAEYCRSFTDKGFVVAEKLISDEECDQAWEAFLRDWENGKVPLGPKPDTFAPAWGRVGNVHHFVKEMHALLHHQKITHLTDLFLGKKAIPYQTIPSFTGSEQLAHSDAIHMTTFPLGFLTAAWIALEDIHPDSGPLQYYPGSHKLRYELCREVGIDFNESQQQGREPYLEKYEPRIAQIIQENNLQPEDFLPKKGDVLFWHHNLIHAGSPVRDHEKTRKSLVCHYFTEGAFAYHDLINAHADVAHNGEYKGDSATEITPTY